MIKIIEVSDSDLVLALKGVGTQFEKSLDLLIYYGNTSVSQKHFDIWVSTCMDLMLTSGCSISADECRERFRVLLSDLAGFPVRFVEADTRPLKDHRYWIPKDFKRSVIFEKCPKEA